MGGFFLQASLIVFFIARFVMVWLMNYIRATKLWRSWRSAAVLLCLYAAFFPGLSGAWAIVAVSFCLSLMFPTIYGVSLRGLGPDTKFGAAFLVMAIVGGAIMPAVKGAVTDATNAAVAFIVPAICFAFVAAYGVYDMSKSRGVDEPKIVMSGHDGCGVSKARAAEGTDGRPRDAPRTDPRVGQRAGVRPRRSAGG